MSLIVSDASSISKSWKWLNRESPIIIKIFKGADYKLILNAISLTDILLNKQPDYPNNTVYSYQSYLSIHRIQNLFFNCGHYLI